MKCLEPGEKMPWTEEDDKKLFIFFKKYGSKWSNIAKKFRNRTENQVKNRFYSTLRRIATKKRRDNPGMYIPEPKSKKDLLQYVDDALEYGHNCCSKRGRIKKRPEPQNPNEELPYSKTILRTSAQTPLTNIGQVELPVFLPLENLPIQLVPSVPPTQEQMDLARQLFKFIQNPVSPNLLFQLEAKEKEIAELKQNMQSLYMMKNRQGKLRGEQSAFSSFNIQANS